MEQLNAVDFSDQRDFGNPVKTTSDGPQVALSSNSFLFQVIQIYWN
jgi:hypothetical protein